MKRALILAVGALLSSFSLSACGGPGTDLPSTTPSSSSSTAVPATESVVPPPSSTPEVAPITFVCGDLSLYQSGTALYSDGTTGYEASCDTYVSPATTQASERVLRYCDYPGTAVYTDGSYSTTDPACAEMRAEANTNPGGGYPYDPDEDRNGDGVVNGYERCGVKCGKEPTSGDIQTQHGCEQGYITGPACEPYSG